MANRNVSRRWRIRSRKQTSNKNPANTFLVLYGANQRERDLMFSQKDTLKSLGFKYFSLTATYSLFSDYLTPGMRAVLTRLGVDLNGYDATLEPVDPLAANMAKDAAPADDAMEKMHAQLATALNNNEKSSALIESIEKMIEEVARGTDEAAQQAFIRNFLEFSSRFYTYSIYNQMLIWIQTKGLARFVAGAKKWEQRFGRRVSLWGKAITILAPARFQEEVEDPATGETHIQEKMRFTRTKVFDVSATVPLPGCTTTFEPISRDMWSKDSNEDSKKSLAIVNALKDFAADREIAVAMEDMEAEKSGYSAGGRIAINRSLKGVNLLSTFVHELAHELLHWKSKKGKRAGRKEKEVDAETTAYIVLKHFGCETKDTTNYLALWRANGDDVRARRKNIQMAAMEIIDGIKKCIGDAPKKKRPGGRNKCRKKAVHAG